MDLLDLRKRSHVRRGVGTTDQGGPGLSFFLRLAVKGSADIRAEFIERRTGILEVPCPQVLLGRRNKHCYQNEPADKGNQAYD